MTYLCKCDVCECRETNCGGTRNVSEPPIGSHLITPRRGYTHHGIYAGAGEVLHYSGLSKSIRSGPVAQIPLAEFANGRPVHVECRRQSPLPEADIVARARSRLGEDRYRLLTNNCEHFAEWSRFGVSRSGQIARWTGLPVSFARTLSAFVSRAWMRRTEEAACLT